MNTDDTAKYQAEMMRTHFGVDAEAHSGNVVMSASEYERLLQLVMSNPLHGFYLGNIDFVVAPDWTFIPLAVASARLIAVFRIGFRSGYRRLRTWMAHSSPTHRPGESDECSSDPG